MADKALSSLTAASTLDGTELAYVVQSSNSRKVTVAGLLGFPHSQAWSGVTSTPTTLSGYGITDAQAKSSKLTTIAGLSSSDGGFLVGDGTTWTVETGSTARSSLGLAIGTDVQAYSADLGTIAGLAKTDGGVIIGNGTSWTLETGATLRTSLGLSIGSDVQAYNASLSSMAGLSLAAGDILYSTGANALDNLPKGTDGQVLQLVSGLPSWASVSGTGDMIAAVYDPGGVGGNAFSQDAMIDGTTNKNYTATEQTKLSGIEALADVTDATNVAAAGAAMKSNNLSDLANAGTARTNLGLAIGSNVQAWAANLDTLAAFTPASVGYVAASRSAMLAFSTSAHTSVLFDGSQWFWDGSDLSATVMGSSQTTTAIDSTLELLTLAGHGLTRGNAITVSSAVNGLALNTLYYVISIRTLSYDAQTTNFTVGQTVTGGTSGATGKIVKDTDAGTTGTLLLKVVSGTFRDNETITDGAGGSATVNGVCLLSTDIFQIATSIANAVAGTAFNLTGTTNFSFRRHKDPGQNLFVCPSSALDGSSGGWKRWNGWSSGSYFANQSPPAKFNYVNDHLLVGPGATGWNGLQYTSGGNGSWLFSQGAGSGPLSYLLTTAYLASVTGDGDGRTAILGAAKPGIGVAGVGVEGWAGYFDATKPLGSTDHANGAEFEITNLDPTTVAVGPYATFVPGWTFALSNGVGAGTSVNPVSYPVSALQYYFWNGSTADKGLVFQGNFGPQSGVLTSDGGVYHAICLPEAHQVEWGEHTTGTVAFALRSDITDATHAASIIAANSNIKFNYGTNPALTLDYVASATNGLRVTPGTTSLIVAPVGAGNINMNLQAVGSVGQTLMAGGNGLAKVAVNNTGIGFFATTPVAKQSITGALSSVTDANAKAVLTSIISALSTPGLVTNSTT